MEALRIAVIVPRALELASRYRRPLGIKGRELPRYVRKTTNLALCYQGFSSGFTFKETEGAGRAAFLSCAYDVATDWRDDSPNWYSVFERIVRREASPELAEMALDLYRKDSDENLADDGLERGSIAFRFVLGAMGLAEEFSKRADIDDVGLLLQIVDDVLDYESDLAAGDLNCLNSPRAIEYLERLAETTDEEVRRLFPGSQVFLIAFRKARGKAQTLLDSWEERP